MAATFYLITNPTFDFASASFFQVTSFLPSSATWARPRCRDTTFVTLKKKEGEPHALSPRRFIFIKLAELQENTL